MKCFSAYLYVAIASIVVSGCAGEQNASPQNQILRTTAQRNSPASWIDPIAAKKSNLLYVSDVANNEVYIYTYPSLNLVGILTGFDNPHGLCVDGAGEVLVVNTNASDLVVYPHGSVLASQTIKDSGQYPIGCSVSVSQDAIAVSNAGTTTGGPGSVTVFSGPPVNYPIASMSTVSYLSYDKAGDLFADGTDASGSFQFAELPRHKTVFKPIDLNQAIGAPGGLQPYGSYIVVGDESTNNVYLVVREQIVGSTSLGGASQVVQFFIAGGTLIGPDSGNASIGLWKYPGGGSPIQIITGSYLNKPTAAVISSVKSKS